MSAALAPPIAGVPTVTSVVERVEDAAADTITIWSRPEGPDADAIAAFRPGQIDMLGVFGVGEVPISRSSDPGDPTLVAHTVRICGRVTTVLGAVEPGDRVTLRGPLGRPWPLERALGGDLVLLAGGLGLAPLRSAIYDAIRNRAAFRRVILLVGARDPSQILYRRELERWNAWHGELEVHLTVDVPDDAWPYREGVVPVLFDDARLDPELTTVFTCGPEIMMRLGLRGLAERGIPAERLWLTMERTMHCGVKLCGHCQLGPLFVCADGPIFRWDEVRDLMEVDEL
jgi:sulfhydrogenase subunit gamma (sulfur reductase)